MKYILLKRGSGEIELWRMDDVRPDSYSTQAAIPAVKAHEAKRPKSLEIPYPPQQPRESQWDGEKGDWVVRKIPPAEAEKYAADFAKYEAAMLGYRVKYETWQKRIQSWAKRKTLIVKRAVKSIDPAIIRYSFAGGNSAGRGLAPRVRLLSAADQRKFDLLDKQIDRLQRRRAALIEASFGRAKKPTPAELWAAVQADSRTTRRRSARPQPELWLNTRTRITPKPAATPVPEPVKKAAA